MAVYLDDANIPATVRRGRAQHTSQWSRLFADTQAELHEFAAKLGLQRSYFQPGQRRGAASPGPHWHYDVTAGKRQQAIGLGARPVTLRQSIEIIAARDARAERARVAGQASHAAGRAFWAGEYAKASRLLNVARQADPSRAGLWAERADRVHAAARAKAAEVARRDDPRPLGSIVSARLDAAGIAADDPAVRFAAAWNAQRYAAAQERQPGHGAQNELAAEPLPELGEGAQRETGQ